MVYAVLPLSVTTVATVIIIQIKINRLRLDLIECIASYCKVLAICSAVNKN